MPTEQLRVLPDRSPVVVAVQTVTDDGAGPVPDGVADAVLSAEERQRSRGMSAHRAAEFTRARIVLRRLCAQQLGVPAAHVPLRVSPRGALSIDGSRAGVSLSHSARHIAAAYWPDGPVGVDIEEPPATLDDRMLVRCMSPLDAGRAQRCAAGERAARFARVWTAQEACVKAVGLGLAGRPWSVPVDVDSTDGRWRDVDWMRSDLVAPEAALAVAVHRPTDEEDNR